ncbi:MAG: glycosyltransferase family 39 protein [Anaerolineae bacterium]|nr:glycosyltransferase family 39 protein [Anaerolineae bacterium]
MQGHLKSRWLVFTGVLIAGSVVVGAFLRRLRLRPPLASHEAAFQHEDVPALPSAPVPARSTPTPHPDSENLLASRWFRWALFIEVLVAFLWLLLNVPPPFSTVIFVGVIALVVWGVRTRPQIDPQFPSAMIKRYLRVDQMVIARAIILIGLGLLAASTYLFRPGSPADSLTSAALLLLLSILVLLTGFALTGKPAVLPVPMLSQTQPKQWALAYKIMLAGGIFLLWLLAEINGGLLGVAFLRGASTGVQFILLCAGVTLVAIGLGAGPIVGGRLTRWEIGFLVLVTLIALTLRFWRLDSAVHFFVDELSFSAGMRRLWADPQIKLLAPMERIAAFPYLFAYLQTFGGDLFGRNLIGLRATGAFLGTMGIPALYLLARTLFDRKTAVIAALLLATYPLHLQFSRIGISEIAAPLFATLALAFLARGMLHDSRPDYAAGGALLGLTHYFHEGSRLLYTPLAVLWVVAIYLLWRPRLNWRHLLVAVVALVLVAAPVYYTLIGLDRPLAARMVNNDSGLAPAYWSDLFAKGGWEKHIQDHVLPPFLFYIHTIDETLFYKGDSGLLLPVIFSLFMLGVIYALRRWRMLGMPLLLLWVLATAMGNSLMVGSAGSPRFVMVFPALMLLAAVGIRYGLALLLPRGQRAQVLLVVLAVGLAVFQTVFYFAYHLPLYNEQFRSNWGHPDAEDAVLRSVDFPAKTRIQIISLAAPEESFLQGMMYFMNEDLTVVTTSRADFDAEYIADLPMRVDFAFYVDQDDQQTVELLRRYFYLLPPEMSPYDVPLAHQFVLYYAPYVRGYSDQQRAEVP